MFQFVLTAALVLSGTTAWAADTGGHVQPVADAQPTTPQAVKAKSPVKKAKRKALRKAVEPVSHAPNGEPMPEREKRLLRECKGRPNAGACLGYAS